MQRELYSMSARQKDKKAKAKKAGPEPETIRVESGIAWENALKHALNKPKPPDGWLGGNGPIEKSNGCGDDEQVDG